MLSKCLTSSSCGKNSVGVDVERQQIAHRVRVFLAIQAVRHDGLVAVVRGRRLVERVLEPRDERHEPLFVGPRLFRRRHRMAAQLAHGHLELLGVLRDVLRARSSRSRCRPRARRRCGNPCNSGRRAAIAPARARQRLAPRMDCTRPACRPLRLLVPRRREVGLTARARIGPTDGAHGDLPRRTDVLLDERRRDLQSARDVVEVLDLFVLRQELRAVDLEREQIADGVGVFLAIQAMRHDRLIAMVRRGRFIERVLEPRHERGELGFVGPRLFRRRHGMTAQLAHGHLELLGVLRHAVGPDLLEVEAARKLGGVVALRAVAIDERPLLRRPFRDGGLAERVAGGEHADGGEHARAAKRVGKSVDRSVPFHVD